MLTKGLKESWRYSSGVKTIDKVVQDLILKNARIKDDPSTKDFKSSHLSMFQFCALLIHIFEPEKELLW